MSTNLTRQKRGIALVGVAMALTLGGWAVSEWVPVLAVAMGAAAIVVGIVGVHMYAKAYAGG